MDALSLPLSPLPLMLWETPPGLELALAQEGVPFVRVRAAHPLAFRAGRFVLFDGRKVTPGQVRANLSGDHVAVDVDLFRPGERVDPFRALIDTEGAPASWSIEGLSVVERVGRYPKARSAASWSTGFARPSHRRAGSGRGSRLIRSLTGRPST